jgi:hypothetical protein
VVERRRLDPVVTETVARRMGWRRVGDVARTSAPSFGPASYARGRMCGTRYPKFTQPPPHVMFITEVHCDRE